MNDSGYLSSLVSDRTIRTRALSNTISASIECGPRSCSRYVMAASVFAVVTLSAATTFAQSSPPPSGASSASPAPSTVDAVPPRIDVLALSDGSTIRAQVIERRTDGSLLVRMVTGEMRVVWLRPPPAPPPAPGAIQPVYAPVLEQPLAPNGPMRTADEPDPALIPTEGRVAITFLPSPGGEHHIGFPAGGYTEQSGNVTLVVRLHRDVCVTPCTLYLSRGEQHLWVSLPRAPDVGFLQQMEPTLDVGVTPATYRVFEGSPGLAITGIVGTAISTIALIGGLAATVLGAVDSSSRAVLPIGIGVSVASVAVLATSITLIAVYSPRLDLVSRGTTHASRRPVLTFGAAPRLDGGTAVATVHF